MKYAIKNENRIEAGTSEEIAKCPICKSDVKAYCGSFVIWHWKHVSKENCDSWWEPETEWHRRWKDNFPKKWQEIVCFDDINGEKHVADVKTNKGIVIEFQNSPISIDELKSRELFYNNLIWVVNAKKFKKNFDLTSIVSDKLISLEHRYRRELYEIEDELEENIEKNKTPCGRIKSETIRFEYACPDDLW